MKEIEFINELLENAKNIEEEVFIPNEIKLKISNLKKFDLNIAKELSNVKRIVFSKKIGNGDEIYIKEEYKTSLIKYSIENDLIKFYPSTLKMYLDEK